VQLKQATSTSKEQLGQISKSKVNNLLFSFHFFCITITESFRLKITIQNRRIMVMATTEACNRKQQACPQVLDWLQHWRRYRSDNRLYACLGHDVDSCTDSRSCFRSKICFYNKPIESIGAGYVTVPLLPIKSSNELLKWW
jgi:hypothetical protein